MKMTKSEMTQEKILNTAAAVFVKEGYSASRTLEIAKSAEVSEATVFKYYKSKQGLLDAIVDRFVKKITKRLIIEPLLDIFEMHKNDSPEVLMKAVFLNRIELMETYKNYAIVTFTESRFHDHIQRTLKEQIAPEIMTMSEMMVQHYKAKGIIKEDTDSWLLVRSMMASVVGMMVSREFLGVESRGGSMEKELEAIIAMILNGVKTEGYK
ncbi:MAG: TetR/AcrR family transcriptional regulator [Clostridia bacterium]|nr:TetR/AcrR family transcriptional regulator [Clostridia bacterium]